MERIKLNLIPSGVAPIVHLSQYDDGRTFEIDLFEGESVYVLDGTETLTVNSRKPDGHVVTLTVTNTGTSSLDVDTVEQLTAVHGVSYAKLKIEKGSVTIATLPFLIDVSRDPLENGDPSESFIQNLATQISDGVAEEVATQYDSSNVIFDAEPTDNHGIGYTVTSEGIKTAIDNAFDYDNTASGNIVHITDGADNIPVKSLVSEIVAVESGNGQPKSPDNPYTISGFDNGIITRCGKNFINLNSFDFTLNSLRFYTSGGDLYLNGTSTGEISSRNTNFKDNINFILKAGTYYFSRGNANTATYLYDYYDNASSPIVTNNGSFTLTEDTRVYIAFYVNNNKTFDNLKIEFMINAGSSATTFEPYNNNKIYTFAFGQTVYGGSADIIKGSGTKTIIGHKLNELTWVYNGTLKCFLNIGNTEIDRNIDDSHYLPDLKCSCFQTNSVTNTIYQRTNYCVASNSTGDIFISCSDYTNVTDFINALGNETIIYPLATPQAFTFEPVSIPTLLGENNFFSNTGDVEVDYYTNKAKDILEFIDSEIGKKNGTNIPIEANSQDSIKDYIDDEVSSTKDYVDNGLSGKADTSDFTIEDLSSSVTLNSAFDTPDYKKMYKYGNVIHLMMRAKLNSNLANNSAVVTMPSRVAPKGNDYAQNLYYGTQYATTTPLNCYFGSFDNGLHTLGAISSGQYVMIDTMWITN